MTIRFPEGRESVSARLHRIERWLNTFRHGIEFEANALSGTPKEILRMVRAGLTHRIKYRAAIEAALAYTDICAIGTGGSEGGRVSAQAGASASDNRAALVASDTSGNLKGSFVAFGNGECRIDGFPVLYAGTDGSLARTTSAGVVTITGGFHTLSTAGNVDTISAASGKSLQAGQVLLVKRTGAITVTLKHGTGNILGSGGADIVLDDDNDMALLVYDGSNWTGGLM